MSKSKTQKQTDQPDSSATPDRFEDLIEELESLVEHIESGDIGLEQSIDAYERGNTLVGKAREILSKAEQRVETIDAASLNKQPTDDPDV